jgi:small GTP-binding protein
MSGFRSDLKIIVIGTSGTGKTSFVNKWTKNIFSDTYKATIVSEFGFKIFEQEGKLYRIQLWDLAGQDKNAMVTKIFAKDAHGCVVMSDATNIQTREDTLRWKSSVDEVATFLDGGKLPCLLVENKADLIDDANAENCPELESFGTNNGFCGSFRTSAKTGLNINEAMNYLIKNIIQRMEAMQSKEGEVFKTERNVVALDPEKHSEVATKRKQKDGCC